MSFIRKRSPEKPVTRYTYNSGPVLFLAQQICKHMEQQGYPSKIYTHFRSAKEQHGKFMSGLSKAQPFESPHQIMEAVDIASAYSPAWPETTDPYWQALKDARDIVAKKFGVELTGGFEWGWDLAHIETTDWKETPIYKINLQLPHSQKRRPNQDELDARFKEILPKVWKRHTKSVAYFR